MIILDWSVIMIGRGGDILNNISPTLFHVYGADGRIINSVCGSGKH
jgi:hypothetical protein